MPTKDFRITCREVVAIQAELLYNWQPPTASGVGYRFEMIRKIFGLLEGVIQK